MSGKPNSEFDLAAQIRALHEQKRALDDLIRQLESLDQDGRPRIAALKRSPVRETRASPR